MHEVVRAESTRFFFLASGGGERDNLRAEDAGELNGHVSEAADPDDAYARGRVEAMVAHWAIHGDATAEQRSSWFAGEGIGNLHYEAGVGAHAIGVSAIAMNAGRFQ